jgi:hypothetical protein
VLLAYGESFPQFLRDIGQGSAANYLADIAQLEAARTRAYHAADATPLGRDAFAGLQPDELPDLRLTLHPSVSLLRSCFPVVSIWEANLYANDNTISEWRQESALVARPYLDVAVHRVSATTCEFLAVLSEGQPVGSAIAHAEAQAPGFDLTESFAVLIAADIVTGIQPASNSL